MDLGILPMFARDRNGTAYSLRRRLTVAMMIGFIVILAVVSVGLWSYARNAANSTYDLLLDGASIAVLERVSMAPDGVAVDFPPSALEILGLAQEDRVFYRIFNGRGETLTGSPDLPLPENDRQGLRDRFFDVVHGGETVRFIIRGRPVPGPAQPQWINVQIGQTRAARDALQWELFTNGLIGLTALAVIGLIFVRIGINMALRPLSGIEADIRDREPSDLDPLKATPPREVESLINAINAFMRRLGTSKDNAQTFIADVAHQMRTSLSSLRGQIDLAAEQEDPEAARERLHKAADQVARTIRLTNQLLSHAMVIHRADSRVRDRVDLADLVKSALEEIIREETDANIDYEFSKLDGAGPMEIAGDAVALREALRNVLDNARKHGGVGGIVKIELTGRQLNGEPAVVIAVEDDGPGIAPEEYENVVKRFYALGGKGDSGIGLAIVKAVVEGHEGRLTLGRACGGGLRVEMILPEGGGNQA